MSGAENSREGAPAVSGVLEALKASAAWFRDAAESEPGIAALGSPPRYSVEMAALCLAALRDLEGMLAASVQRVATDKPKPPLSPSALFRMGFTYGGTAGAYHMMTDEAKEAAGPAPPANWEAAWAEVRALLATGGEP